MTAANSSASSSHLLARRTALALLLLPLLLCLSLPTLPSLAQPTSDCSGVACPELANCLKDVLEHGQCCPTCLLRGCPCEGHRRRRCIDAGYSAGSVPEGVSVFIGGVPGGAGGGADVIAPAGEECLCPLGGGALGCVALSAPCPELPPHCVETVQGADGCPQCLHLGCLGDGRAYAAGHTVQAPGCRLCHCPASGGELLCYPLPDCEPALWDTAGATGASLSEQQQRRATGNGEGDGDGGDDAGKRGDVRQLQYEVRPSQWNGAPEVVPGPAERTGESDEVVEANENETAVAMAMHGEGQPAGAAMGKAVERDGLQQAGEEAVGRVQPPLAGAGGEAGGVGRNGSEPVPLTSQTYAALPRADQLQECCTSGQRWAAKRQQCSDLPRPANDLEACRMAQKRCCLASLEDASCQAGMTTARQVLGCGSHIDSCSGSMYQPCCDCCLLGLKTQSQGLACTDLQGLGQLCSLVYRTCCASGQNSTAERGDQFQKQNEWRDDPDVPASQQQVDKCRALGKTCAHKCVEAGTGVQCACHIGYRLRSDAVTCEDVNECLTDEHHCQEGQRCINTVGSFRCQREISCGTGYELTELNHCQDIDECETGTHNCGEELKCQNTLGSFRCRPREQCGAGFLQDALGSCIDINECTTQLDICQLGYNCINTVGSFTCQRHIINCGRGYHASPDGGRCVDVDECQTGAHQCGDGQQCQNTPGSYRCNCASGYYYDTLGRTCVDINECRQYPGRLCSHTCENVPGSYHCSCSRGFQLGTDGKTCEDTNECESSPCSQECANVIGSYQCYCRRGFQPSEVDGVTCEDVDECSLPGSNGGLCAYRCANVPGSFECYCPAYGYTMSPNGRSCLDLDECGTGTHNCSSSENCFNMQGGFRCLSYQCPSNYRRSAENRCERMSCADPQDCASSPVRITYYQLSFPRTVPLPANIFRIGPSPAYAGDTITLGLTAGNHEGLFATRKMNAYTGVVYMQRAPDSPRDLLLNVEMRLFRQGTFTTFLAKIYAFITSEDF
ncbi:fibulin-1-like [Lampetra planeri]